MYFAFEAELQAIMMGVDLARDWNDLWIESDSSFVVNFVKNRLFSLPWHLRAH